VTEIYRYLMKVSNKKIGSCLHRSSHKFASRAEVYVGKQLASLAEPQSRTEDHFKRRILSLICRVWAKLPNRISVTCTCVEEYRPNGFIYEDCGLRLANCTRHQQLCTCVKLTAKGRIQLAKATTSIHSGEGLTDRDIASRS
jgi:hypothetical protein